MKVRTSLILLIVVSLVPRKLPGAWWIGAQDLFAEYMNKSAGSFFSMDGGYTEALVHSFQGQN